MVIFLLLVLFVFDASCGDRKMVISAPVVDLRHLPKPAEDFTYDKQDVLQSSQLLFGERIHALEEQDGWIKVKALEQNIFVNNKWQSFVGWIRSDQATDVDSFPDYDLVVKESLSYIYFPEDKKKMLVSVGTELKSIARYGKFWQVEAFVGKRSFIEADHVFEIGQMSETSKTDLRLSIVAMAERFIGAPYFFGGRSFHNNKLTTQRTSVDCSALANLCYKAHGIKIPRNSISQYESSQKLPLRPEPADLIFLGHNKNPLSIFHVLLYAGNDEVIEAKGGAIRLVRKMKCRERFGKKIYELRSGDNVVGGDTIFFGRNSSLVGEKVRQLVNDPRSKLKVCN
jgi:hypothetical protein